MNDIVKYMACIKRRHDHPDALVKVLPRIFERELQAVVARELKLAPTIVTFYGGASREGDKRHRWVTNWNLLTPIARGAVRFEAVASELWVTFWLGFPRTIFFALLLLVISLAALLGAVFLVSGKPLAEVLFAALFLAIVTFL